MQSDVGDYMEAKDKSQKPSLSKQVWTSLEPRSMKLKMDGAIFPEQYRASVSCVLREDQGRVTIVATKSKMSFSDPWKWNF